MTKNYIYRTGRRRNNAWKKRSYSRKKPSKMSFAKGRARMPRAKARFTRQLNSIAEKKVINGNPTTGNINFNGNFINPVFPSQGTAKTGRVGNKIFLRYIVISGFYDQNQSATALIRVALVWPKRRDVAIGDFPLNDYNQPFDIDKFTIVWDKLIPLNSITGTAGTQQNNGALTKHPFKYNVRVMKSFNFDDGTTTPQETWPVLFYYSASSNIATNPTINYYIRTTYTDV